VALAACAGTGGDGPGRAGAASETPGVATARPDADAGPFVPPDAARLALAPERVLLVSIAGLSPRAYGAAGERAWMPALAALARAGVRADAVVPVVPASPGPAHATLATGRAPSVHGLASDHPLGARGVDPARYREASAIEAPAIWTLARGAGASTALLGWPASVGAEVDWLFPELIPARLGEASPALLEGRVAPTSLWEAARALGVDRPEAGFPGPPRDDLLAALACHVLSSAEPPRLTLLRLSQTELPLRRAGPDSAEAARAFAGADAALARVLACLDAAGRLATTALLAVGDAPATPVHTLVEPNVALAGAGLLVPRPAGSSGVQRWDAIVRSNGTSAFVYARDSESAVLARRALTEAAERTRAFRVVSAEEMLALATDRDAWFGLEASPGYVIGDGLGSRGALLPSAARGAFGALTAGPSDALGFVAWGAGVRAGVRVPELRQTDVAPTVARLLRFGLPASEGRPLVGALRPPPPAVAAPRGIPGGP
jgi:hypothetical protein